MVKKSSERLTSSKRLDVVESRMEDMEKSISTVAKLSENILAKISSLNEGSRVPEFDVATNSAGQVPVVPQPVFNMAHSGLDSKVVNTNVETKEIKTKGCFEILTALIEQYPNKVSVSSPHLKKDGTVGKSYILNMPRIDENFVLVNKEGTTKAQQVNEAKTLWKAVAFNGYTFTGKYWTQGKGSVFTTYIKQSNEAGFLDFLKNKGIHIPRKDHNDPNKKKEEGE